MQKVVQSTCALIQNVLRFESVTKWMGQTSFDYFVCCFGGGGGGQGYLKKFGANFFLFA